MDPSLEPVVEAIGTAQKRKEQKPEGEVIAVSETVSAAASFYEVVRNTLEYDEEHLLRRNAIRRILKRRMDEVTFDKLAADLLRELIWARYLPNKRVPERMVNTVSDVLEKYRPLFAALREDSELGARSYAWLLDMLSTEIEYILEPPLVDEALASFAYGKLKERMEWLSPAVSEADRDLQLYIAVHRAVLKSNIATLRFRTFTLYYPAWTGPEGKQIAADIAGHLGTVIDSVERQVNHPASDAVFRLVRAHAVVFHLLRDIAEDDPDAFAHAVSVGDLNRIDLALGKAASARYARFHERLTRSVLRAVVFLFITKTFLALLIELPFEQLVLRTASWTPLLVNIVFHPLLLSFIGLTVRIPAKKNTPKIIEEAHGLLGLGKDFMVTFRLKRTTTGALAVLFRLFYAVISLTTIGAVAFALYLLDFNALSIAFFLFFLSLVTFFGLKIRNSKRELVVIEPGGGFLGVIGDILFLPIVRAGRWIAMRAPRINVFLFFFDFIVEAPFKAAIRMVEGWLAFLREKREEI